MSNVAPEEALLDLPTSSREATGSTNAFRAILTDMEWLAQKFDQGYSFTLLGRDVESLQSSLNAPESNLIQSHLIQLTMLITKDGHFVLCTPDFIPSNVFGSPGSPVTVNSDIVLEAEPTCRVVNVDSRGLSISLPLKAQSTRDPLFLEAQRYLPKTALELTSSESMSSFGIPYIYASKYTEVTSFAKGYLPVFNRQPPGILHIESILERNNIRYNFRFAITAEEN